MPRSSPWSNGGAVGVEITPHMRDLLLELHRTHNSHVSAEKHSVSRAVLASTVRYVELKLKRKLFFRTAGRGNATWLPLNDSFWRWLEARPNGGHDWPRQH